MRVNTSVDVQEGVCHGCEENMGWSNDCSMQSPQVIHGMVIWVMNLDVEVMQ